MGPTENLRHARETLLKVATKLFIERGYNGVSTRELAEAADVNLGAIQYHFGSKAKLFVEAKAKFGIGKNNVRDTMAVLVRDKAVEQHDLPRKGTRAEIAESGGVKIG